MGTTADSERPSSRGQLSIMRPHRRMPGIKSSYVVAIIFRLLRSDCQILVGRAHGSSSPVLRANTSYWTLKTFLACHFSKRENLTKDTIMAHFRSKTFPSFVSRIYL